MCCEDTEGTKEAEGIFGVPHGGCQVAQRKNLLKGEDTTWHKDSLHELVFEYKKCHKVLGNNRSYILLPTVHQNF